MYSQFCSRFNLHRQLHIATPSLPLTCDGRVSVVEDQLLEEGREVLAIEELQAEVLDREWREGEVRTDCLFPVGQKQCVFIDLEVVDCGEIASRLRYNVPD